MGLLPSSAMLVQEGAVASCTAKAQGAASSETASFDPILPPGPYDCIRDGGEHLHHQPGPQPQQNCRSRRPGPGQAARQPLRDCHPQPGRQPDPLRGRQSPGQGYPRKLLLDLAQRAAQPARGRRRPHHLRRASCQPGHGAPEHRLQPAGSNGEACSSRQRFSIRCSCKWI